MRDIRRAVRRTTAAGLVAVAALVSLTACFDSPPPPDGSEAALRKLTSALERLPHVVSASGELRPVDAKDHPDEWLALVTVRSDTADLGGAPAVRERAAAGVTGTDLVVTLDVPRGDGLAPVRVDPTDDGLVAVADRLRRGRLVRSVTLDHDHGTVEVRDSATWSEAVALVRPLLGDRRVTLHNDRGDVGVDATRPGAALLHVLDTAALGEVSAWLGDTYATARTPVAFRAVLSAAVRDPAATAAVLERTADEAADAHLAPRTAFILRDRSVDGEGRGSVEGFLGLPLGSPTPDDSDVPGARGPAGTGRGPDDDAPNRPEDPAPPPWTPVAVVAQTAAVRGFVEASARTTGVAADVTTSVEQCAPAGTSAMSGTRAVALTVVPVFTRYDDPQVPFDAVVGQWRAAGFRTSGRAMGQDFFSAPSPGPEDVASASIRGTADGLSLGATSSCVG